MGVEVVVGVVAGDGEGVCNGVLAGVGEGVGSGVLVGNRDGVGVVVGDGDGVGVGVAVGDGDGVGSMGLMYNSELENQAEPLSSPPYVPLQTCIQGIIATGVTRAPSG